LALLLLVAAVDDFSECVGRGAGVAVLVAGLALAFAIGAFFTVADLATAAFTGVFFF